MYNTQAFFLASIPEKKGCLDVQHSSKIDQNIVTHEKYVAMLIMAVLYQRDITILLLNQSLWLPVKKLYSKD